MIEYYQQPQFQPFALEHPDDSGNRAGAMLVHGFTGTPADMRPLAEALFERSADCHVPMHPGMAADIANMNTMTADIWRENMLERWAEHTRRYARTVLIGYSMGGAAAVQMAAQTAPDLLILIAPFVRINDRRAIFLPLVKHMIKEFRLLGNLDFDNADVRLWFKAALPDLDLDDPETRRVVRDDTGIASPVIDELRKFGAMGRRDAPGVTAPVVVIQGHQDIVVNPRHTRDLLDHFPQLRAYHEVPGDHLITLDSLPSWSTVRSLVLAEADAVIGMPTRA
ncbi:MAG: alpha/beta fold hydrolase [Chloroflexota bacterium]|nr:alpha/beta fold hydrolase [Chloroflexota bacterium]